MQFDLPKCELRWARRTYLDRTFGLQSPLRRRMPEP